MFSALPMPRVEWKDPNMRYALCAFPLVGLAIGLAQILWAAVCGLGLPPVLRGMGLHVQGSDMTESDTVRHLRSLGIPVAIGHNAENLGDCDLVVRTAAVHDSNPEIAGAVARGIPVYERAQAWGAIMQRYPNALCVAGTHGKTTTTSMCTHIFMAAEADPTVMIGGTLPLLHAGYRVGQGDTIILESCEYCNSFLSFFPTVAVILNVEEDHLDFFKDLTDIQHSFRRFAELVPPAGAVIVNADNASAMEAVAGLEHPIFTFGLDHTADCTAANLTEVDGRPVFDVMIRGEKYARVELHVYGHHNVLNALAAASAAYVLELPGQAVEAGLAAIKPWGLLGDVGAAVHEYAKAQGYSVVREYGGHGCGFEFHEDPFVSFVSEPGEGMVLVPGMTFTIEPMVNAGAPDIDSSDPNGWTVRTADGSDTAQWEVQVLITETGYELLSW